MRLLVTNDDGMDCLCLHELVRALREAGHECYVVAPKSEQSWIGAAKSRHRAVTSGRVERGFGCPTWIVDGTPSDCVNIALAHLLPMSGYPAPEAVVSGINVGLNASVAFIIASGTVGGAWEGALHGLPAVAISQDLSLEAFEQLKYGGGQVDQSLTACLRHTAAHAARFAGELLARQAPRCFIVHNLNYPFAARPNATVVRTVPAQLIMPGLFSPAADDGTHRFVFKLGDDVSPSEPLTDRAAIASGLISHTILDYRALGRAMMGAG